MEGQVQVSWNRTSERVTVPSFVLLFCLHVRCAFIESRSLGFERKMCDKFHIKLNTGARPIANKYCEGKMKRTLERELKVPEIAEREAIETFVFPWVPLDVCGLSPPFSVIGFGGVCIASIQSIPWVWSASAGLVTILPKEGKPLVGCYSLGLYCSLSC